MIIYEYQHLAHKTYFNMWWNTREMVLKIDTFSDRNIIGVVKKHSLKKSYKGCWNQTFLVLVTWITYSLNFLYVFITVENNQDWLHEKYKAVWVIHSRSATEGNYYIHRQKGTASAFYCSRKG